MPGRGWSMPGGGWSAPGGGGLAAALAEAGLALDAYLTGDGSWVRAVPASCGDALGRSPR